MSGGGDEWGGDEASFLLTFEHVFNVLHACLLASSVVSVLQT